jgi:hypothetical protein
MQIVKNIKKSSGRLKQFFNDVYAYFFDLDGMDFEEEDEEEQEGFETINNLTGKKAEIRLPDETIKRMTDEDRVIRGETVADVIGRTDGAIVTDLNKAGLTDVKEFTKEKQKTAADAEKTTHNVDYVKDNLNPIKRETMFKMISIDSQFRENARTTPSTNFALNLSTSIENVISIKLYSINIPYAWYTINDGFGSNFFYIKGASPGINNGNHDIKIEVPSGNYNQSRLIEKLNKDINDKKTLYADVSFGQTELLYDNDNSKVRIFVDMRKTFTEADYVLYFPDWTSPNIAGGRTGSIASFLGFNYDTYYPLLVTSNYTAINNANLTNALSEARFLYTTGVNNTLRIVQYTGPNVFSEGAIINDISLVLTGFANGVQYSRTDLLSGLRTALAASSYFDHAYTDISLITVEPKTPQQLAIDGWDYEWAGHSHFVLGIKLNRMTTKNVVGAKVAVIFPDESSILDDTKRIWTGNNSCFMFPTLVNELSEILSETVTTVTNFIVDQSANYIEFSCKDTALNVPENTYRSTIPASSNVGYSLSELKTAINQALVTMNNATVVSPNLLNGVFNINSNSAGTFFDISGDKAFFQFDIKKIFDQSAFIIDLSSCFLSRDPFGFDTSINYLTSSNYVIEKPYGAGQITVGNNEFIRYIPKSEPAYGNQNLPAFDVPLPPTTKPVGDIPAYLNDIFQKFDLSGQKVLYYSRLDITNNSTIFSLNLRVEQIVTTSEYQARFVSTTSNTVWSNIKILNGINITYDLSANNGCVQGNTPIYSSTMNVKDGQNMLVFKPYYDGVADENDLNDIVFTVPVGNTGALDYTRDALILKIQELFNANPLTQGSTITVLQEAGTTNQYTKIRMHIKKQYEPHDYKLVFYDGISFRYCSTGSSGGNSIRTATWEATLGWLLGFHTFTEYTLQDFTTITSESLSTENYASNVYSGIDSTHGTFVNSYNSTNGQIVVQSDSIFNTYIYNYFMIVLDDFIQNHVNDGLVTITSLESDISLPTYASRVTYQCDPVTGKKVAVSASNKERLNLNAKQLYAMNQIVEARKTKDRSYTPGPVLKDIFAIIPLKLSGLQFGAPYMEFGGSLQNQDRKYFGPVRLQKLAVKLMNDKGDIVNLNGTNWSFTIICEILVKKT